MEVAEHLERLGGIATRATLIALTSRRRLDRALADGSVVQASRGRCSLPTAGEALARALAVRGVVSHLSAAAWWGWGLKSRPRFPEVTVPKHRRLAGRLVGPPVGVHVADLTEEEIHEGRVTTPARTLLDCLRRLPFDEGLAVADSALRCRGVTRQELDLVAARARGPGAPRVRRAAGAARVEAANPFESVLRALALQAGLDVVPQATVRHGAEWVVPDLVDRRRCLVLEADSFTWHGDRMAFRRDCQRYNWLVRHGWRVLRLCYEDVMGDQRYALDLLRAAAYP